MIDKKYNMLTSKQIRQNYLDFFKQKEHKIISSASLLPINDPSLLFVNSGMSPLVPYLSGEKHPEGIRIANSQKCFRTEDIEEVGDNRHNTFFEMLGNWSLGDYFKKEQLEWWFEFLFDKLKINPNNIYQTVYLGDDSLNIPRDVESISTIISIFKKYGITANVGPDTIGRGELGPGREIDFKNEKIFAYQDKNWWQRGDAIGELGGPDSETFYDTGKKHNKEYGEYCHPNCDCGRFIEIGNSVFMQYKKSKNGWEELPAKNVDFGGGLERITMAVQGENNIFKTDLFVNILNKIEDLSNKEYANNQKEFEIIADHVKAAIFIIGDERGVIPSNTDQGYIARRLIRRAVRFARNLGIKDKTWINELVKTTISNYEDIYTELRLNKEKIITEINKEEKKFNTTIEAGFIKFHDLLKTKKNKDSNIRGVEAFNLYATHGFPLEMTVELAKEVGLTVDKNNFQIELEKHQKLSRTSSKSKFKGGLADNSEETKKLHTATHLMLGALRKVLGEHIEQKGSNITAERLRFDFSHPNKLTKSQKKDVEDLVNEAINSKADIKIKEMSIKDAKNQNVIGVFTSKYGEKVKVYTIQNNDTIFSKEMCGGPHVKNTGELGCFRIKKEESSSSGIRRIKAILE